MTPEPEPTADLPPAEAERLCRALDAAWEGLRQGAAPEAGEDVTPGDLKVLAALHQARRSVAEDSTADSTRDWSPADSQAEDRDAAPGLALAPGSRLGDYAIRRFLSRGGMGEVYLAEHELMGRQVVVKVLPADRREAASALRRFRTEIQAQARLGTHPHLAAAFHAGEHEGCIFLVQEYVPGTDLRGHVLRVGPLDPARACDYIRQAALGLEHAHRHSVIHRDIKPSNLMLTPEGAVKILDLGLAQAAREAAGPGEGQTQAGAILGTPEYMAPEQAEDPRRADARSDLYSLGCTLYFLLTGRPPFARGSTLSTLRAHALEPPPPVRQVRPEVPEAVAAVLDHLLAKRPEKRFASARELVTALEGLGTARPRPVRPARRSWLRAPVAGLLLAVAAGLLLFAVAGLLLEELLPKKELKREAGQTPAPAPPVRSGTVQVTWHIDHYRPGKNKEDLIEQRPLGAPGSVVRQGDRVVLRAQFSEPVYPYVLAISADWPAELLLPDPREDPGLAKPVKELRAPVEPNQFYTLDDPGFQALVLLASWERLPAIEHWRPDVNLQAWRQVRTSLAWGFDGKGLGPLAQQRVGVAEHGPKALADVCRSLQARPGVAAVRAAAFPVQPKINVPKGGQP
jgi:tRNA A-37 threonylcarbamoyl transferase component Bud32